MKKRIVREIDFIELVIKWFTHWRWLLGIIIVVFLLSYINGVEENTDSNQSLIVNEKVDLSTLTDKQLSSLSDGELEKCIDNIALNSVEELVELNNHYEKALKVYNENCNELTINDRAEALDYLIESRTMMENSIKSFTEEEKIVYYRLIGLSQYNANDIDTIEKNESNNISWIKKGVILTLVLWVLFFVGYSLVYILDDRIKSGDDIAGDLGIYEFARIVKDKTKHNGKKNQLKGEGNFEDGYYVNELIEINANAIVQKSYELGINSIAIVGGGKGLSQENEKICLSIKDLDKELQIKTINNTFSDIEGMKALKGVEGVVLTGRVGTSKYEDITKEYQSIINKNIPIMGLIIYE